MLHSARTGSISVTSAVDKDSESHVLRLLQPIFIVTIHRLDVSERPADFKLRVMQGNEPGPANPSLAPA